MRIKVSEVVILTQNVSGIGQELCDLGAFEFGLFLKVSEIMKFKNVKGLIRIKFKIWHF